MYLWSLLKNGHLASELPAFASLLRCKVAARADDLIAAVPQAMRYVSIV